MRVLVTGVANWWGTRLARRLVAAGHEVIGVDTRAPEARGEITFVEADLRSPDLGPVLRAAGIEAVIHNDITQFPEPGRDERALHDHNVIGTLQLLTACADLPALHTLVVRGSAAIYGAEADAPSFFTEDLARSAPRRFRFQRDCGELEGLVASFARRTPQVTCCVLRMQPQVARGMDSPITRLVVRRVVPTVLGFDPRVQVLDGEDAVAALHRAVERPVSGPINVAPPDVHPLSRVLREVGRIALPIAAPLYGQLVRGAPAELSRYMRFGRGVDVHRMRRELGFTPAHGTIDALARVAA